MFLLGAQLGFTASAQVLTGIQLLPGDPATADMFGYSVSIDGDLAVVGSIRDDDGCVAPDCDTGSAYLFARQSDKSWLQIKKLAAPSPEAGDQFGTQVGILGDTVVVTADLADSVGVDSGAAYLFRRDQGGTGQWGFVKELTSALVGAGDRFGSQLAMSDGVIAVASFEGLSLFDEDRGGPGNWGERPQPPSGIPAGSVAMYGDLIVLGMPLDDVVCPPENSNCNSGAVLIVQKDQGGQDNWGQLAEVTAPDAAEGANFGWAVSLDGDTLVVGAILDDAEGSSSGAAYVFERHHGGNENWGFIKKLVGSNTGEGDWLGTAVNVARDEILVTARDGDCPGAAGSGVAYLYVRNLGGASAWGEEKVLCSTTPADGDRFGWDLDRRAGQAIISAREDNAGAGSAFVVSLALFEDDFESEDTCAWSSTLGSSDTCDS